ncbi:Mannose-6-phosphate isomerase 1 [Linum perenne]
MGSEFVNESSERLHRLRCSVQNYDWGRVGNDSLVGRLSALNSGTGSGSPENNKPCAELWMGVHDSGPSFVIGVGGLESLSLKDWIVENPCVLGDKVLRKWGTHLPFLFKILSVSKALSIQAHPDRELAMELHKSNPMAYKDDNHKPEMALALTHFEGLCGFVSLQELRDVLRNTPEMLKLVNREDINQLLQVNDHDHDQEEDKVKSRLFKSIFTQLMSASKEITTKAVSTLKTRLQTQSQVRKLTDKENLVLKLEKQYPGDVGVISALFLNHVKLNPGQALYIGANEPHAYVCGECIEVMATSDNVVRAGLTPKFRDVRTLCSMLTYKLGVPEMLNGFPVNQYTTRYLPPFDEFEVDRCLLPKGESTVFPAVNGPSIFVVTSGEGVMEARFSGPALGDGVVREGDVIFAPAEMQINVTCTGSELHLYRAGVNSRFLQIA